MASFQARGAVKEEEDEETRSKVHLRSPELNKAAGTSREPKVNMRRQRIDSDATTMAPGSCRPSPLMTPCTSESMTTSNFTLPVAEVPGDEIFSGDESYFELTCDESLDDPVSRVSSPLHKTRRLAGSSENEATAMHDTRSQMTSQQLGEIAHLDALALMAKHSIGVMQETPPTSPRVTEAAAPDTPRTPRTMKPPVRSPPPRTKRQIFQPSMLRALQLRSMEQVLAILQRSPEAARELFWDHEFEPLLCAAVRLECSADIVRLLLEHGADPHAKNVRGYTPARMLRELSSPVNFQPTPTPPWDAAPLVPDGLDTRSGLFDFLAAQRVETTPCSLNAHMLGIQEILDAKHVNATVRRQEVADLLEMHSGAW